MSLIKAITVNLLERDYKIVTNSKYEQTINDDLTHIAFLKPYGTVMYCVGLINCDVVSDCIAMYKYLLDCFKNYANNHRYVSYVFVGLFLSKKPTEEITDFCTYDIDDYSEKFTEVRWVVDVDRRKIVINGSQPCKILDLSSRVNLALKNFEYNDKSEVLSDLINNENKKRNQSIKTQRVILSYVLIAINVIVLASTYLTGGLDKSPLMQYGAMSADNVLGIGEYYRLYTSMFLHYGIVHLASNALFLYVFGSSVEKYFGRWRLLFIYLGSGIVGGLTFCFLSTGVAVGASAAVFGLVGAMLTYSLKVKRQVDGRDTYFMLLFAVVSICSGFLSESIANSAHIGGFLFGMLSGWLLT